MSKAKWNALVDALMFVCILDVGFIGILMGFFIPKGAVPAAQKILWGLHRHTWGDIHLYFSLALVALFIIHFILHLSWIDATGKRFVRMRWPVLTLVLALAAALLLGVVGTAKVGSNIKYENIETGVRHDGERINNELGAHESVRGHGRGPGDGSGRGR